MLKRVYKRIKFLFPKVMNELGVEVNDLYSVSAEFDNSLHSDWVHFGTEGSKILADKVIEACFKNEE